MTVWLLSIVGIVFLGVMVDVVAPSGKTNAFIRSMFAVFLIYVVIAPVVKYFKSASQVDFSKSYFESSDETNLKISEAEHKITRLMLDNQINGVDVKILGYVSKDKIVAKKVILNGAKSVLNCTDEHIDKYKLITELIQSVVMVNKEDIVYG